MSGSSRNQVHYEIFARKTPQSSWALQMALEDRDVAIQNAKDMLANGHLAAVMVSKETMDNETGEFRSLSVFNEGTKAAPVKAKVVRDSDAVCSSPQELYTAMARDKIARLLEEWLKRNRVTPYELLHRPDLAERLEATGTELQHVVQKLAVPESQETGQDLHDLMRRWRALIDKTTNRVIQDGRKNLFPVIDPGQDSGKWLAVIEKVQSHPERAYVLGGGIAGMLAKDTSAAVKLEKLMGLAEILSHNLTGREWAMQQIEAVVVEIFSSRASLADVLGQEVDLGTSMAILTRMAASHECDLVAKFDPNIGRLIPPLTGVLAGLNTLMEKGCFPLLSYNISKRLMQELKSPRRLKPSDPEAEIELLRALALCMSAAGKEETHREDIKEAFIERSRMLITADFVESLAKLAKTPTDEVERLIWLCENVAGSANKRQAARWLVSTIGALKFERDIHDPSRTVPQRLAVLAQMQKRIMNAQLPDKDCEDLTVKLGAIGAQLAGSVQLIAQMLKSGAPPLHKLNLLLSFASGQAAPLGPISEQAKGEVMRILRNPETRQSLMSNPQALAMLKPMMQAAGLAD